MNFIRYQTTQPPRFQDLAQEFSRVFERADSQGTTSSATVDWTPPVDISEHTDRFVLIADLPGVEPAAVEVTLEKGVLTLAGSRERAVDQPSVETKRQERVSGRFFRRFALPDTVDGEAVTASNKHGVLEVVIPKRAASQPRRISVNH